MKIKHYEDENNVKKLLFLQVQSLINLFNKKKINCFSIKSNKKNHFSFQELDFSASFFKIAASISSKSY